MTEKAGPLTLEELEALWEATNDRGFTRALQEAGEGRGYESYTQMFAQLARVSQAVDVTTQSMFLLPWSGQTAEPAAGERKAQVLLTFTRSGLLDRPLILTTGQVWVQEQQWDWSESNGELVQTGRRYQLLEDAVFPPGVQGPVTVLAAAQLPGWGYNNPLPGSLSLIEQPGSGFNNDGASIRVVNAGGTTAVDNTLIARAYLDAANKADAPIPDHVGQYVLFTAGANTGIARAVNYSPPNLGASPATGGTLELQWLAVASLPPGNVVGTFIRDELVALKDSTFTVRGYGQFVDIRTVAGVVYLTYQQRNMQGTYTGSIAYITGQNSSAQATLSSVLVQPHFVAEAGTSAWQVLDWAADWGLICTNTQQPAGGRLGFLDELGKERNTLRAPSEEDDTYRQRIAQPADNVSPNAIRRTISRVMGNLPWCFREVGTDSLKGFFLDHDFYDYDNRAFTPSGLSGVFQANEPVQVFTSTGMLHGLGYYATSLGGTVILVHKTGEPGVGDVVKGLRSGAQVTVSALVPTDANAKRFNAYLSYEQFRAFFLVGVPEITLGEFGFAYDFHPYDAFDEAFYDGYAVGGASLYRTLVQALDSVRAGGVSFDIYRETGSCS